MRLHKFALILPATGDQRLYFYAGPALSSALDVLSFALEGVCTTCCHLATSSLLVVLMNLLGENACAKGLTFLLK